MTSDIIVDNKNENKEKNNEHKNNKIRICVVGMGYVGLPLAVKLSKNFSVTGFDINTAKITSLKNNIDPADELTSEELKQAPIEYTTDPSIIKNCSFIIVAVPTPVTKAKIPDLIPIVKASETVGKYLAKDSIVVFESTVYPGTTQEVCVPIIEKNSGMNCGVDWKIGYSPERVNPGDKLHTIDKIVKVVSGMDEESLKIIMQVYGSFTQVYPAQSIKVAEAAKIIENTQRDLNIALMNELSLIFRLMDIDTHDVLNAASTKWNFHKYTPGMVGGHCIGVDPYYLTFKAQELGYNPQVILAGRAINDSVGKHVAELTVKGLNKLGKKIQGSKVLILGLTFKENVRDPRNSKTVDVIRELREYGVEVIAYDPFLTQEEIDTEDFEVKNTQLSEVDKIDAIILTVPHKEFMDKTFDEYSGFFEDSKLFVDVKGLMNREDALRKGYTYIRL